jgi:hypothetical protein
MAAEITHRAAARNRSLSTTRNWPTHPGSKTEVIAVA